ncbi:ABC transporter ATP-binding protein [Brackiella oedipodis]|uniref:ABC transporter ATP-binding protein n=1 Tax=Brackiella oedipodis TaxID=124225 RepID=UPI0006850CD4|nr:ABC transporter ATP-binding protein [Brackiella oedipodis]
MSERSCTDSEQTVILDIQGLQAWYGQAQILFDLNLQVHKGEAVALMGPNGAGKSTTMKAIMGLVKHQAHTLDFLGKDILALSTHQIARRGLAYVPEERRIFADLSVEENLQCAYQAPRKWPDGSPVHTWTLEELFSLFPNLAKLRKRLGGQMSGGEQQMLSIARSLMGNPYVVLLDEPSEGVAPIIIDQLAQSLITLKQKGLTILLSEQNQFFAQQICDRRYFLAQGQMVQA